MKSDLINEQHNAVAIHARIVALCGASSLQSDIVLQMSKKQQAKQPAKLAAAIVKTGAKTGAKTLKVAAGAVKLSEYVNGYAKLRGIDTAAYRAQAQLTCAASRGLAIGTAAASAAHIGAHFAVDSKALYGVSIVNGTLCKAEFNGKQIDAMHFGKCVVGLDGFTVFRSFAEFLTWANKNAETVAEVEGVGECNKGRTATRVLGGLSARYAFGLLYNKGKACGVFRMESGTCAKGEKFAGWRMAAHGGE